jgi:hypothetical protein
MTAPDPRTCEAALTRVASDLEEMHIAIDLWEAAVLIRAGRQP